MKNAGLTHGGFYGHFDSKEQLMAEACEYAIGVTGRRWRRLVSDSDGPSTDILARRYLSKRHRDAPGDGCVLAALAGDAARQSPPVRAAFTGSVKRFIDLLGNALPTRAKPPAGRRRWPPAPPWWARWCCPGRWTTRRFPKNSSTPWPPSCPARTNPGFFNSNIGVQP